VLLFCRTLCADIDQRRRDRPSTVRQRRQDPNRGLAPLDVCDGDVYSTIETATRVTASTFDRQRFRVLSGSPRGGCDRLSRPPSDGNDSGGRAPPCQNSPVTIRPKRAWSMRARADLRQTRYNLIAKPWHCAARAVVLVRAPEVTAIIRTWRQSLWK
jgi:hypothetical protein